MRIRRKACRLFMLLLISALVLTAVPVRARAEAAPKTVLVGYYENEIFEEGAGVGQVKTGYAYEYYRKLSEYTGWKYEYVYGGFGDLYQMLLDGQIDLLAGLAYREDRSGLIGYPDAIMGNETYYLVRHDADQDITSDPATLSGKAIGVLDSAMVDVLNRFLAGHGIEAQVVPYPDHDQLFTAFDTHQVDLLAAESDGTYGRDHAEAVMPFGTSEYYLCVNIRRPDLLQELNEAQLQLTAEEPNFLNSLSAKYYSLSVTARAFSEAERAWMSGHDTLHIGYLENYLPYSDTDAQGQVTGLIKDYMPALLSALGIAHMDVTYTGYSSYDRMIDAMSALEIDAAFPVGGGLYYSEENGIYQSAAVASATTELIYTGEFADDTIKTFAVNENNRMQYYYVRTNYPEAEIQLYPSIEDCLSAVLSGQAGVTTLNGLRANDILRNRKYDGLSMHQANRSDDRSFGVEIGNEGLLKLLNRGINILGSDYAQNLSYRYTGGLYNYGVGDMLQDHIEIFIAAILLVVALILFLLIRDSRRNKSRLREKEQAQALLESKNRELEMGRNALRETDEIIADAGFGIWHIELEEGRAPRMRGNAKMLKLLGIEGQSLSEEEVYQAWYSRILPEEVPSVEKSVGEMLDGRLSENTYRWEHPTLGTRYVRCGGVAKIREKGHQLLRGYHSDVTEMQVQQLAHQAQREQQNKMITALASDYRSVYYVDLDRDEAICYRNDPRFTEAPDLGATFPYLSDFAAFAGNHVSEQYREGYLAFIQPENIREALKKQQVISYRFLELQDGRESYAMLRMAGVRRPEDRPDQMVHAIGVGFSDIDEAMRRDMAQQRELSAALDSAEQANRAKTAFLSNMSHEIRTPMNAIIGLNNIAMNDPTASDRVKEYLEKIGASAHHLLGIINDILDMSRIESGRMVIKKEEFSFAKSLEQVNNMVNGQCREKGLKYECFTIGKVDDYYIGDAMKLRQIMLNILGNAVKFTPTGGTVSFFIEEGPRYEGKATLKLTFRDTGIGMSSEYLPHIFDAFSQEDSSSTSRYGSTGLGMPITRSLVELMNGHIEVESEKGVGTTFTVTVTLDESDRRDRDLDGQELDPRDLSVLVIDDDLIALEHAEIVLGQIGISCETAESGWEGLDKVRIRHGRREDYDLILVDWKMPEMDGVETTRRIREIVGHNTPIIILTSFNWDDIADEARAAGVDTFVPKPLFAGNVLDEFREAFRRKNEALSKKAVDLKGRRVLLAEDMPVNAEIMVMVLGMKEIDVDVAENGRIAVEAFAGHEPGYYDAILMDMRMPEMDGLEATKAIRAMNRADARTIPIIALTANAFDEDVQRSMQAGLNAHLSKPIEPEALFETLEGLIDR